MGVVVVDVVVAAVVATVVFFVLRLSFSVLLSLLLFVCFLRVGVATSQPACASLQVHCLHVPLPKPMRQASSRCAETSSCSSRVEIFCFAIWLLLPMRLHVVVICLFCC